MYEGSVSGNMRVHSLIHLYISARTFSRFLPRPTFSIKALHSFTLEAPGVQLHPDAKHGKMNINDEMKVSLLLIVT